MYLHKSHENGENENLAQGEVAGLRIKVESNLASSNVNESGNNAVVKKNGDSAARKKRGPYKSRQEPPNGFKRPNINMEEVLQQQEEEDGEPKVKVEKKSFKGEACASTFVSEGRRALH